MTASTRTPELAPRDNRRALLETGLRKFVDDRSGRGIEVLYTDTRRATQGWRGLTDAEMYALRDGKCVTVGPILHEDGGRQRVMLTDEGRDLRDQLLRRPR